MLKKVFKIGALSALIYVLMCFVTPFNERLRVRSIENQINYLDEIMQAGYDDELQMQFLEGKMFSNAIFSLSVVEFCDNVSLVDVRYADMLDASMRRMLSQKALDSFDEEMLPPYGMFYNAWSLFALKSYQASKLFELSSVQEEVNSAAVMIEERLLLEQGSEPRVLNSYPRSSWPADNLIGLVSLDDNSVKDDWLAVIFKGALHDSGLIHHEGKRGVEIRGSSQAMISFCLNKMGYSGAVAYTDEFKKRFVDDYWGVQLVNEHEDGSSQMDIDSGPVVFGYGASATIMNIKTQAHIDDEYSKMTWAAMNSISLPVNLFGRKYYLFQQEPMLDIFMLWACVELS